VAVTEGSLTENLNKTEVRLWTDRFVKTLVEAYDSWSIKRWKGAATLHASQIPAARLRT
jgi:hypothetical protein